MNRVDTLRQKYSPQSAIVVYKSSLTNDYYLENHAVNEKGQLMAGSPLRQETIQAMVDAFYTEQQSRIKVSGMIPDYLLQFIPRPGGRYVMTWYREATHRVIHFSASLKIPSVLFPVPALVYHVDGKELSIYALKGDRRPKMTDKLYMAPYHNTDDEGLVCLGSVKVARPAVTTYETLTKYWEDLFWLGEFTHVNGDGPTKTDLTKLYRQLAKVKKTSAPWPEDELKESQIKFKDLIA